MCCDKAPQRNGGNGLQIFRWPGLGRHQPRRQPVSADANSHMAEVVICRTTLPHAAGARYFDKRSRIWMAPLQGGALGGAGVVGLVAQGGQVAEEILALLVQF